MTREEILSLDTEIVTKEIFENIFESDCIIGFQNAGRSGIYTGYLWYILTLDDGTDINLYCKES